MHLDSAVLWCFQLAVSKFMLLDFSVDLREVVQLSAKKHACVTPPLQSTRGRRGATSKLASHTQKALISESKADKRLK